MGYKRQNFHVDPDDKEQVAKYIDMRTKFARVSPAHFMKYLETGSEQVKSGTNSQMQLWAVPKANFPKGLLGKIKAAEVAADSEHGSIEIDRDQYFVIDQCVPRDQLGKGVYIVTAYSGTENKFQTSGPAPSCALPAQAPPSAAPAEAEPELSLQPEERVSSRGQGQRRLRENPSDAFKEEGFEEETESAAAKQARVLKETLLTLRHNIEAAKSANVWNSTNQLSNNSVLFWVEQTVGALEEMVADSAGRRPQCESIVSRFTCYLLELAQQSEIYPEWVAFKGLLPRLIAAGGQGVTSGSPTRRLCSRTWRMRIRPRMDLSLWMVCRCSVARTSTTARSIAASFTIGSHSRSSKRRRPQAPNSA